MNGNPLVSGFQDDLDPDDEFLSKDNQVILHLRIFVNLRTNVRHFLMLII